MIILDTNVLSEMMRPTPSSRVLRWVGQYPALRLFTTAITQAEILYGLELLPKGNDEASCSWPPRRCSRKNFPGRILPFDGDAALVFPQIACARRAVGRPVTQFDTQIAASVRARGAAVATRNTDDFDGCGVAVLNPWVDE
jgi:toxin FitB